MSQMQTSTIVHIIHNYENIIRALNEQLGKIEGTMEGLNASNLEIPVAIHKLYVKVSDARASLKDSYYSLVDIKDIQFDR